MAALTPITHDILFFNRKGEITAKNFFLDEHMTQFRLAPDYLIIDNVQARRAISPDIEFPLATMFEGAYNFGDYDITLELADSSEDHVQSGIYLFGVCDRWKIPEYFGGVSASCLTKAGDWRSINMPSIEAYFAWLKDNFDIDNNDDSVFSQWLSAAKINALHRHNNSTPAELFKEIEAQTQKDRNIARLSILYPPHGKDAPIQPNLALVKSEETPPLPPPAPAPEPEPEPEITDAELAEGAIPVPLSGSLSEIEKLPDGAVLVA